MRIGIDLHGTITDDPPYYRDLMKYLSREHDVFVVSGPPYEKIARELKNLNINDFEIFSIVDFLRSKNIPMRQDEKGDWWSVEDLDWWTSKAKICGENNINLLIDNDSRYKYHLKTFSPSTIFLFHQVDDACKMNHTISW